MPAPDPEPDERWMAVARLLRPQGRRGELLAEPLTDISEVFSPGRVFRLSAGQGSPKGLEPKSAVLEDSWRPQGRNAGRLVVKLAGVGSISDAELMEGLELLLAESQLPALAADTFLVRDLVGCELFDGDHAVGTVADLQFPVGTDGRTRIPDAVDLLVVQPLGALPDTDPVLVPFVKAWLQSVDIEQKRITMTLPEGLFESLSDSESEIT